MRPYDEEGVTPPQSPLARPMPSYGAASPGSAWSEEEGEDTPKTTLSSVVDESNSPAPAGLPEEVSFLLS